MSTAPKMIARNHLIQENQKKACTEKALSGTFVPGFSVFLLTRTSRKRKTFKHEGRDGAQRKTLKLLLRVTLCPLCLIFLLFVQGFNFKVPKGHAS